MAEDNEETKSLGDMAKNAWDAFKEKAGSVVGALTDNDDEDSEQNENSLQSEDQNQTENGNKVYILNNTDSNHPEIYTSDQIDKMRNMIVAIDQENYGVMSGIGRQALADGTYAEEIAKTSDRGTAHLDGRTTSSDDIAENTKTASSDDLYATDFGKGKHDVIIGMRGDNPEQIICDNKLDISTDGEGQSSFTPEECDHMKELVAEADAIDGKGTYEDNLECLMNHDYEQYGESQSLENEQENVYVIKTDPSAQNTEAYTSSQIDTMRMIVAQHDGLSTADLSSYQNPYQSEAIAGTSSLNEHYINGEFCGELGTDVKAKITAEADATELTEDNFVEGSGSLSCKDYKGDDVSTEFNNSLKIDPMHVELNGWSDEDYSHMEEIIAAADACDGKGTYNSNLEQLQKLNPEYSKEQSLEDSDNLQNSQDDTINPYATEEETEQRPSNDYDHPSHRGNTELDNDADYANAGINDELEDENANKTAYNKNTAMDNMAKIAAAVAVSQSILDNMDLAEGQYGDAEKE